MNVSTAFALLSIIAIVLEAILSARQLVDNASPPAAYFLVTVIAGLGAASMLLWVSVHTLVPIIGAIYLAAGFLLLFPERILKAVGGPIDLEPFARAQRAVLEARSREEPPASEDEVRRLLADVRRAAPWGTRDYAATYSAIIEADLAGVSPDDPAQVSRLARLRRLEARLQRRYARAHGWNGQDPLDESSSIGPLGRHHRDA